MTLTPPRLLLVHVPARLRPLTPHEVAACIDADGRVRCPWCGRFARLSDLRPAVLAPMCWSCRVRR